MSLIETAIGWLAPPQCISCGEEGCALCEICCESEIIPFGSRCWRCAKLSDRSRTCGSCRQNGTPRYVWITTDYEGTAKKLVSIYKFGHLRAAAEPIADLMAETFLSNNSDERIKKYRYLVVPVPTATSRIRQRSFGHAELLAHMLAGRLELEGASVLGRLGQQRQVGKRRANRLAQTKDNYFVRQPQKLAGRNILLVDDVVTTGATLQAVTSALRQAGARHVDALVFAKRL